MKSFLPSLLASIVVLPFLFSAVVAQEEGPPSVLRPGPKNLSDALGRLELTGTATGAEGNVESVLGTVIQGALTLVGTIFFILMIYAGYLWMTARGEEGQIDKAKQIISATVIGLVIVVSAYAITVFVTGRFAGGSGPAAGHCNYNLLRNGAYTEYCEDVVSDAECQVLCDNNTDYSGCIFTASVECADSN